MSKNGWLTARLRSKMSFFNKRWNLVYLRTRFFGGSANMLNRISNMPPAKEGGRTKTLP